MVRLIGGAIAGMIVWIAVVTILNLGLRHGWPAYAAVERAMVFTVPMMAARLAESAVASLAGGYAAARIDRGGPAALLSGVALLLLFIPVHYALWPKFPIWYHLAFLASLPLLGWAGGRIVARRR